MLPTRHTDGLRTDLPNGCFPNGHGFACGRRSWRKLIFFGFASVLGFVVGGVRTDGTPMHHLDIDRYFSGLCRQAFHKIW
jgi:hypothetical protein